MSKITFLGPIGSTFSHNAYEILNRIHNTPKVSVDNYIPAKQNGEILSLIIKHGGYGAVAMETLAEGRISEPLESFIDLLKDFNEDMCPFHIIGAIQLEINFCLITNPGVTIEEIKGVIAHPKSLSACKQKLDILWKPQTEISSNGEAARLVAENSKYKYFAAIGPESASQKYNLQIVDDTYEDSKAITTFFCIGPKKHKVVTGNRNRMLITFRLKHKPGALVSALKPFEEAGLNLIQIHSVHTGNHTYDFIIEIDVRKDQLPCLDKVLEEFKKVNDRYLFFGPFEVLSK